MSRSLKPRADFADAARHVSAADTPIPPMNSESGRSVELLMMLVSVVAASPSDAMPTPDEVQMNCESDSMMFVMSDILLGRSNRLLRQLVEVDDGSTATNDLATLDRHDIEQVVVLDHTCGF